jgi:predicted AAA+ superfamily ATPase
MERYLAEPIKLDLRKKLVLVSGPRQVGKTTMARGLYEKHEYRNYDVPEHRVGIAERTWNRQTDLVVLDELHKMRKWKSYLKGIYDAEGISTPIIVTGSARLDLARKMGDSLAGRFFAFRLHPLTMKELKGHAPRDVTFDRLLSQGGFPEPFFAGEEFFYPRWQRSHLDIILRQDLLDLEQVRQIVGIETLVELLRHRVGSPVSYQSLAEDLQVDQTTVKRWIGILENLFVIFKITPWHRNVARSLLKAPKYYFYDNGQVIGDRGQKLENLVAAALLREVHLEQDVRGRRVMLHYLRNKDGNEVDFAVAESGRVNLMVEVKWDEAIPSKNFGPLRPRGTEAPAVQVVGTLGAVNRPAPHLTILPAAEWLEDLTL